MVLCNRCKKRMAVVFISTGANTKPQGLCLQCAKELGVPQINSMMENMGITDEMIENLGSQMENMMNNPEEMQEALSGMLGDAGGEEEPEDGAEEENPSGFQMGGAQPFPKALQNFLGHLTNPGNNVPNADAPKSPEKPDEPVREKGKDKKEKPVRRKYIGAYCEDLTKKAREGRIDRIVGRDAEIARVVQILSRRTKNNPCLVGEPGVGKTAIAEGLALRIAAGEVPFRLQDKEIHLLDLTALVAGTQFRGQFESRIKGLIEEVRSAGNIILFIDEVHSLVGTGESEGSMNAANILKPALSRGEIQVIGATTFNEYRKYIEKDAALERRFQQVRILEPSIEETVQVLLGIKSYYETFHRVSVPEALVRKAVVYSERYITDRFLPDKAIDLLDEACTCAALRNLKLRDYDIASRALSEKRAEEEQCVSEEQEAIDYEKLAMLRMDIARLEQQAEALRPEALGAAVTEDDLAQVLALWTGIPTERIRSSEFQRLGELEEALRRKIIGQDEAVKKIAAAVRRTRAHISPRRRPASFILVGPTGVGKTELVKVLSQELFDTPETLIRLDMSEFMEKHSVSKIIGSPPGYVGYEEAGQVTEKVRRRPYSVLLFDEIEKAHPDVMNILLQILDEGHITDAQGRTVNFENTILVMTSNAGSDRRENLLGFGKTADDAAQEKADKALREFLRPEFLSRVDEVIIFRNLTETDFAEIAALMLKEYVQTLAEKGIAFSWSAEAEKMIAQKAFGGAAGARDIRNVIRREVEDPLASLMIAQSDRGLSAATLSVSDGKLCLTGN